MAGCGSSDDSSSDGSGGSDSSPIKVGNISTLSGAIVLPFGEEGAGAYFDAVNAEGGVNGRQIDFIVADDKLNPTVASQAARKLIQQDGVVAFAGGISLVDCSVNGKLYEQEQVANVMAGASDPTCFENEMISPVNVGALAGITAGLLFLDEQGATPVCTLNNNIPTLNDAYPKAVEKYEEVSGNESVFESHAVTPNANLTTLMLQVQDSGCKGLDATFSGPQVQALVKAVNQVGFDGTVLFGGAAYDAATPGVLGAEGEGVFTEAELYPYTEKSDVLKPITEDFDEAGVELTGLAESGWLSAKILVDTMKEIDGEINRDSVREALQALTDYDTKGLTATPYVFGPGDAHNPNQSIYPVEIKNGKWDSSEYDWVTIPQSGE
jgi:branched-chain amino acid transport system substrate-binding protein